MSTIDFNDLKLLGIYSTVVDSGSFAAAARQLNSSRSRISEQVSLLESRLQIRLLQRTTRRLTTTTEGRQVYEQARQLPQLLQSVETIAAADTPSGRVSMTMTHDFAHRFVLPLLPHFTEQHPDIELDFILDDQSLDLVEQQIDLALRVSLPKDDSVVARVLHQESFGLFASRTYVEQYGQPKTPDDLHGHRWVMATHQQRGGLPFHYDEHRLVIQPERVHRCNSPHLLIQMALAGVGIAALLPTTVQTDVARGELIRLLPELTTDPVNYYLVYPSRRHIPLRTRTVIDFLLQANLFSAAPASPTG